MPTDPHREGFRILRREPALVAMELLWRWSFGLGLLALTFFAYAQLRQVLFLSDADQLRLSGQSPQAIAQTLAAILVQALPLLTRTFAQVFTVSSVLWIAASSLGRGIITRGIVHRFAAESATSIAPDSPRWASFATLMFARVLMLLIIFIGYLAGGILASLTDPTGKHLIGSSVIVFAALSIACLLWGYVNWVVSLAPIFVVRDALSPLDSIVEALAFLRRQRPVLVTVAVQNAFVRSAFAIFITLLAAITVAFRFSLPVWLYALLLACETLVYFVLSDLALLARLAAYCCVAVGEIEPVSHIPENHSNSVTR